MKEKIRLVTISNLMYLWRRISYDGMQRWGKDKKGKMKYGGKYAQILIFKTSEK